MKYLVFVLLTLSFVSAGCVDINSASIDELDEIVWVGPATAEKIIGTRPYDSLDDLTRVSGIGDSKLNDIINQGLACVDEKEEEISEDEEIDKKEVDVVKEIVLVKEVPKTISLNGGNADSVPGGELIYVSKNGMIIDWLPYLFALFLILVIVILLWERF